MELRSMDFKIPKINMWKDSVEKVENMCEQTGTFAREVKTIKRVKWKY